MTPPHTPPATRRRGHRLVRGSVEALLAGCLGLVLVGYVTLVRSPGTRAVAAVLLALCVLVILAVTVRGSLGAGYGGFSWRLGESIASELVSVNHGLGLLNVVGNVVMFVPVGWLTAVLARRGPFAVGVLAAAGFSAAIEVWQSWSGWFGDIDDVALNSVGGVIGAALAVALTALSRSRGRGAAPSGSRQTGISAQ